MFGGGKRALKGRQKDQHADRNTKKLYNFNMLTIWKCEGVRKQKSISKQPCYKAAASSLCQVQRFSPKEAYWKKVGEGLQ